MSANMRMPGFTAESSLYTNCKPYAREGDARNHSGELGVTPQFGRYRCSSYDEHGCKQCCDIHGSFCWWQCMGHQLPM